MKQKQQKDLSEFENNIFGGLPDVPKKKNWPLLVISFLWVIGFVFLIIKTISIISK